MDTHSIGEVRCPAFSWGMHSRSRVAAQFRPEVVEERSSTVEMLSNALMFAGMATVAAGAGMARGSAEGIAQRAWLPSFTPGGSLKVFDPNSVRSAMLIRS